MTGTHVETPSARSFAGRAGLDEQALPEILVDPQVLGARFEGLGGFGQIFFGTVVRFLA